MRTLCTRTSLIIFALLLSTSLCAEERKYNNGNLITQDIPEIPPEIAADLNQYQNVRSASFQSWSETGRALFIKTRFGDVTQIHKVSQPGGSRSQLTFYNEPIGSVSRDPGSNRLSFTMDAGGSEFSQIFILDPDTGRSTMLTDGKSRNRNVQWARNGNSIAYTSTERNGRSNDIWMMEVDEPESKQLIHQSQDGSLWAAADFNADTSQLLIINYVSVVDSRIYLKDLNSGDTVSLAGGDDQRSINYPVGFDDTDTGIFFLTDQGSEFTQLVWAPIDNPTEIKRISSSINWDVDSVVLSDNRRRGAFIVNAGGLSQLHLLDTRTHRHKRVEGLPTGLVGNMKFSPDGRSLAMTLNTPKTPSDTFVLSLGRNALSQGKLTRWTYSEVGGLDTDSFIEPELIEYPTFDGRKIPAFFYRPKGDGPFPVIISIHGGPEGQALPRFSSTYQMWLAKLGAAVLVPNVRGSAGYGRDYLQLDNGFLREDSVKDIGALLDWVATEPQLDEDRVAVFGGSYGGYMVLASAVHFSDRLVAAIDVVGISNFVTFLENTQDYRRDLRRVEYGDERDPDMRAFLERISPLNSTHKIKIPMLVVQGQNDPRVPVTEAEQLVKALKNQGQPVWYMNALNEGHGYAKKENRDLYRQATMLFLQRYLTPK